MADTSLSLLQRLQQEPDAGTWQRFVDLYAPHIDRWLARHRLQEADRADLVQEVLQIMVRKLPEFQRLRSGSFRAWLRVVTVNCLRGFWRSENRRPLTADDSDILKAIDELADPQSALANQWNAEYDRNLVRRLLAILEPMFEPTTRLAFQRVALEGRKPSEAAAELGLSVNAVLLAKSRVLRQLRRELDGLMEHSSFS
ncbi:MAG: RNA polymerase sigma factor [Planctomycetes bacterium]|nr:RNA polymerase sigma factor [Planctomycetota bacterium]